MNGYDGYEWVWMAGGVGKISKDLNELHPRVDLSHGGNTPDERRGWCENRPSALLGRR